jgi:hypothetical protein
MSQPRQEGEIHRADPAYKRQMWAWFAFTVVAGAVVLFALDRWLDALRAGMAADQGVTFGLWLQRITAGLCVMFAVAAAVFGLWLRRLAEATRRERRWPPSSMRTSSDIRVRYLTSADALVLQFRVGAAILFVLATLLLAWAAWLALFGR